MHRAEPELTPAEILEHYNHICALCFGHAVAVHEIVPKSKMPTGWWAFDNRIPLCNGCHELVHREGTRKWSPRLKEARQLLSGLLAAGSMK